jgi:2-keto-4-pentenoate hydratase/2-oxohepta-3-ene-1,7-dioic acid hydratase in catechol pathway
MRSYPLRYGSFCGGKGVLSISASGRAAAVSHRLPGLPLPNKALASCAAYLTNFQELNSELEVATVVYCQSHNIVTAEADEYISGFIHHEWPECPLCGLEKMLLNLGPAKGKDFCTAIGPWLVTPDELAPYRVPTKPGYAGYAYNLRRERTPSQRGQCS